MDYGKYLYSAAISVISALNCLASEGAGSATAVYLKASATGDGTGTSWENAFTSVADAIADAAEKGLPLYVCQGVYIIPEAIALPKGYAVYGGFPGNSMAETLADRDRDRYQTIFTGDRDLDDVWQHRVPNTSYGFTTTTLEERVISGGRINEPPEFTEDYDVYTPSIVGSNTEVAFTGEASNGIMDGVIISGFNSPGSNNKTYCVVNLVSASGGVYDFNNCRFVGNAGQYGMIFNAAGNGVDVRNCDFTFNWGKWRGSGLTQHANFRTITNNTFLSLARATADAGMIFNAWGGSQFIIRNCRIVRCAQASGTGWQTMYGGAGAIYGSESGAACYIYDSVMTNNYVATSSKTGASFFSGRGTTHLKNCLFANNLAECKVQEAGKAYTMFGSSGAETDRAYRTFEGTTFSDNMIRAREVTLTSGGYALGIVGNHQQGSDSILLNCTFVNNKTETMVEKEDLSPVFCRGLLTYAPSAGKRDQAGLANCTFYGPANGQYDIAQYGAAHSKVLNIVNCLFEADTDAILNPVYMEAPHLVKLYNCSILNKITTNGETATYEGLAYDKIPFTQVEADSSIGRFVLRPDAMVPAIRETCDVATNNGTTVTWVFRKPGETAWQSLAPDLVSVSGSSFDNRLVSDAKGDSRPAGSFTRGAVQALSANAESGASVVLRRYPFAAATFSTCATQSAPADGTITEVTAENADSDIFEFDGWYTENGTKFSESETLSGSFPAGTTVLTAKYNARPVTITFDLDGTGEFTETSQSVISIPCAPGSVFPAIPSYTIYPEWHSFGFDTPSIVAMTNTLYKLKYISSSVRIVHVVPESEAPAVQNGETWATAYTDIAQAYADAGQYRGEVWVKKGRYLITKPITMIPNVAIRGGFNGTETEAAQADPETNMTIITGDTKGDNYWSPNNVVHSMYNLPENKIWTETDGTWTYNPPLPNPSKYTYRTPKGNYSDDATGFMHNSAGAATNNTLSGLVITCFRSSVILSSSSMANGLTIKNCRFLANNTECVGSVEMNGVICITGSDFMIEDCEFEGNWYPVSVTAASATPITIRGTDFKYNTGAAYNAPIRTMGSTVLDISGSTFYRNFQNSAGGQGASALAIRSSGTHVITDCEFRENLSIGNAHGTICFSSGAANARIEGCRFIGNRVENTDAYENTHSAGIAYYNGIGTVLIKDTHFEGNIVTSTISNANNWPTTVLSANAGITTMLNCSIVNNTNTVSIAESLNKTASVFSSGKLAIVNCSFRDSVFSGNNSAEIHSAGTLGNNIINSVFDTSVNPESYIPFKNADAVQQISLSNVFARNYDETQFASLAANGYCTDVISGGSYAFPRRAMEKNGQKAQQASSRFARSGRPVWLSNLYVYFYDDVTKPATPWRRADDRASFAATVAGITTDTPTAPDAFGAPRRDYPSPSALGPVNLTTGFSIILR